MQYKISTVMPVYNSALYLGEAIESIISQTIGFDNVQLIIVNDGSTDNSAEIIDTYARKYSNIVVINQENAGVAEARNEALKHAQGKYVSFVDPDDVISDNAYELAFDFFESNYDKTSVVAFPIFFFGARNGAHPLNDKFEQGSRIIDLEKSGIFQLHITSTLIKGEIAKNMHFKSELATSEDAEALLRILIDTPYLGVVTDASYNYRRHGASLISTASSKKEWYLPHIEHYFSSIMDYALITYGKIPSFVQNAIMYDLSWKLSQKTLPPCLDNDEAQEFLMQMYACVSRLDNSVIMSANVADEIKYYLLAKKHADKYSLTDDDLTLDGISCLSMCRYSLDFVEREDGKIKISTRLFFPASMQNIDTGVLYLNGHAISSKPSFGEKAHILGNCIAKTAMLEFVIDTKDLCERNAIYFGAKIEDKTVIFANVIFGKHCPLERKYSASFIDLGDIVISYHENALVAEFASKKEIKSRKRALLKEIWRSNGFAERKAVVARLLAGVYKKLHKKPIWIISDRLNKASDNGEALFEYLNKIKFRDASYFFAIRDGEDYARLKGHGRVLDRASLKYKILHLASDMIISSHAEDFVTNPFDYYSQPYKDILCQKKFVFLQHGVTKDDLSSWLGRYNKNIKGFVVSSPLEEKSILEGDYGYTENEVWLTGMPRLDRLESKSEKIVAIMPTWRRYLAGSIDISSGEWRNSEAIRNSEYVSFYESLLNDSRLLNTLDKNGYKMIFIPHPNMKAVCDFIDTPSGVSICESCDYSDIFAKANLVVTDYSSAVFDLAYLGKPVIYAQFDKDEFFSGTHTYKKGYFDYEENGFGEVTYTLDDTVCEIIKCIEGGCVLDEKYRARIDAFFAYRDRENSSRTLEKIKQLGAKNDKRK